MKAVMDVGDRTGSFRVPFMLVVAGTRVGSCQRRLAWHRKPRGGPFVERLRTLVQSKHVSGLSDADKNFSF